MHGTERDAEAGQRVLRRLGNADIHQACSGRWRQSAVWAVIGCLGEGGCVAFAIKAALADPLAAGFEFGAHKTMYGGKHIAAGDTVFLFASETQGGRGLVARGVVTGVAAVARLRGVARQTPLVSVSVRRTALARRRLGRDEVRRMVDWSDGRPGTEINFKLYRQATNKVVGLSDAAAAFLDGFF